MDETPDQIRPVSSPTTQSVQLGYQTDSGDSGLSLLDLWQIIAGQKWLVVTSVFVFFAGAVGAALWVTPVYRSEALLEVVVSEDASGGLSALRGQFGGLANLAGVNLGGGGSKDSALAVLNSRAFIAEFLRDEKLLPVLFYKEWNEKEKGWIDKDPAGIPTMWDAVLRFREDVLSVSEDRQSGLVTLRIEWVDPQLAARWANLLVSRVNEHLRDLAIRESGESIEFLNRELAKTQFSETRDAISNLLEQLINKVMMANVREEFAFKVLDPAVASPDDKYVEPKRLLWVILGALMGGFLGIIGALVRHTLSRQTRD